jgi:hypothetical protein
VDKEEREDIVVHAAASTGVFSAISVVEEREYCAVCVEELLDKRRLEILFPHMDAG